MKKLHSNTILLLAIGAMFLVPAAYANEHGNRGGDGIDKSYDEKVDVNIDNSVDSKLERKDEVNRDVDIRGDVHVVGIIPITASSSAMINDTQMNHDNDVDNEHHQNNASTGDNALKGAAGNIGVNIAAGDNNLQDNAAAISAADAYFVFGAGDATIMVNQDTVDNEIYNKGNVNNASIGGSALANAAGNIGVNIASGNSNLQKNNLSAASIPARMGSAMINVVQQADGNKVKNEGGFTAVTDEVRVKLNVNLDQGRKTADIDAHYSGGSIGVYGGVTEGTTTGTADQIGDVYPDVWAYNPEFATDDQHPNSPEQVSHFDLDTETQGGSDLNGDGGALAFTEDGSYSGSEFGGTFAKEGGRIDGEISDLEMAGNACGTIYETHWVETPTVNNASLGENAMMNARGNIGVNIASGTNNLQANNLALMVSSPGLGPVTGGGGTPGGEQ